MKIDIDTSYIHDSRTIFCKEYRANDFTNSATNCASTNLTEKLADGTNIYVNTRTISLIQHTSTYRLVNSILKNKFASNLETGTTSTTTYITNYLYYSDKHLYITGSSRWVYDPTPPKLAPMQQLREIIRSRQSPIILSRRDPIQRASDIKEIRARQTLRRVVGEQQFRNFLKHGCVSLKAKSGRVYQIFPGSKFTNVYEAGKMIEKLCVVLSGSFPPTDSVIMRYLMLLNDEERFIKTAIAYSAGHRQLTLNPAPSGSLSEILQQLRAA